MTDAPFWPRRSPAFLRVRRAVRGAAGARGTSGAAGESLDDAGVVVGLSGGPDSLVLTAAAAAEFGGGRVHAVVVDHGLQEGSDRVAERAAAAARGFGATARVVRVDVAGVAGRPGAGGPEAAARTARHRALHEVAAEMGRPLLLAHTLDDQAETVLLGLARGAGPAALSGMAPDRTWDDGVRVLRPLLGVRRADTVAACAELGAEPWHDPHNDDPRFARVRARATALPMLEDLFGPGVAANLARTADLLRADDEALDALATAVTGADDGGGAGELRAADVVTHPRAVRTRALKKWAEANGAAALTAAHVRALDDLARGGRGRGHVALPAADTPDEHGGRLVAHKKGGTLAVSWVSGTGHAPAPEPAVTPSQRPPGSAGRKGRPHA